MFLQKMIQRKKRDERGFSLATVIFAMLILGVLGLSTSPVVSTLSRGSLLELQGQQALFVAEGGLQWILQRDFQDSNDFGLLTPPSGSTSLGRGSFSLAYSNQATASIDIISTAQVGASIRKIFQHAEKVAGTGYGLQAGGDIDMISSQFGTGLVTGPVSYTGAFSADGGYTFTDPATQGPAPPAVDLASILNLTTTTHAGNLAINGNYSGNVHVTGNVTVNLAGNGATATISGVIIADGNVTVTLQQDQILTVNGTVGAQGDMTLNAQQGSSGVWTAQPVNGVMQPLLIAEGNINFDDFQDTNVIFNGLIRAGGDVDFKLRQDDVVTVNGAIVANGDITSDSKQGSAISIDFGAGGNFLQKPLKLTDWKEV